MHSFTVGEGLGIISRYPITETHKLKLSRNSNDGLDFHQRLLLGVTVQIKKYQLLDVYTTHLSLSEDARTRTLPEIGKYTNDELHSKIGAVLMGDFNCEFDYIEPAMNILSSPKFGLLDVWKEKGHCDADGSDAVQYSYNYHHGIKNDVWQPMDAMFKSPNSELIKDVVVEQAVFDDDFNAAHYDFDAFSDYVYRDMEEGDEWWRDDRCKDGWTFNSWDMKKRIDYFYVDKQLFDKVADIRIVGNDTLKIIKDLNPVGGVHDMFDTLFPSDHRFLYIDIEP